MEIIPHIDALGETLGKCLEEVGLRHCYYGHGDNYGIDYYTHNIFKEVSEEYLTFWRRRKRTRVHHIVVAEVITEPHHREGGAWNQFIKKQPYYTVKMTKRGKEVTEPLKTALEKFESVSNVSVKLILQYETDNA